MKTKQLLLAALAAFLVSTPSRAETPIDQAVAALKKNDLATAESLLVPLVNTAQPNPEAVYRLGLVRLQQNRVKDAVDLGEQATKLDAAKPEYFSQLGMAYAAQMNGASFMQVAMISGRMKKAFQQSVDLDPHHLPGLIGLTRYYTNAPEIVGGSLTKARELAGQIEKLDAFLGAMELGRIAEKDEDYATALSHFERASKLKPESATALLLAGKVLVKLDRKPEARAHFESALKIAPNLEPAKKALAELDAPAAS